MNVLILEDNPERNHEFRQAMPCSILTETADDCIARLDRAWDLLYLDHDLGGEVYVDSSEPNTGMEVVRWIEKHRPAISRIIVHSHNTEASENMVRRLLACGYRAQYAPFGSQPIMTSDSGAMRAG